SEFGGSFLERPWLRKRNQFASISGKSWAFKTEISLDLVARFKTCGTATICSSEKSSTCSQLTGKGSMAGRNIRAKPPAGSCTARSAYASSEGSEIAEKGAISL